MIEIDIYKSSKLSCIWIDIQVWIHVPKRNCSRTSISNTLRVQISIFSWTFLKAISSFDFAHVLMQFLLCLRIRTCVQSYCYRLTYFNFCLVKTYSEIFFDKLVLDNWCKFLFIIHDGGDAMKILRCMKHIASMPKIVVWIWLVSSDHLHIKGIWASRRWAKRLTQFTMCTQWCIFVDNISLQHIQKNSK